MLDACAVVSLSYAVKDSPAQMTSYEAHIIDPVPSLDHPFGVGFVASIGV